VTLVAHVRTETAPKLDIWLLSPTLDNLLFTAARSFYFDPGGDALSKHTEGFDPLRVPACARLLSGLEPARRVAR
jgi:hypothetical protein